MQLGLKAKEAFAVSLVTFLAVTAATLLHLSELSRIEVQEAIRQAELIAKQIYSQSSRALARGPGRPPLRALRRDQELRTLIEASVTYSPHLLYAMIADRQGKVVLHSDQAREGEQVAERPSLDDLLERNVVSRFWAMYSGPKIYEVVLPLTLNGEAFGSIKLGVASRLLRNELANSGQKSVILAGAFLPVAWFVAFGFANLARRPIRRLVQEIDRLRRGDFSSLTGATAQMEDEYKELASQLQLLGQELQSDRLQTLGEKEHKTVQSLIHYSTKLAALGQLTSGMAHEVKNPLNAMMIHLELLKEKLEMPVEAGQLQVQQNLEVIECEIRRLDRVVQGFLKFIRPQDLALKPLDLNALLEITMTPLATEWNPKGVLFLCEFDKTLPVITADEDLLNQAFLNILLNACQAMPRGGRVMVRTERLEDDSVKVIIRDEGVGIPPEDRDKIFKLYYTTKSGGSGIGLSLVYRIIQLHDGEIIVQSEVGQGTTMVVRLP